jgi:paraquat-inducible protein B
MIKEKATQVLGTETYGATIPVLIYLEPGRLEIGDNLDAVELLRGNIEGAVKNGLRATLQTGNLITGKLYVALDQYPNEAPASLGKFNEYMEIPTLPSGLGRFEEKIVALLDKLEALPLENTVLTANNTLHQLDKTLASTQKSVQALHVILNTDGARQLPAELSATVTELRSVLSELSSDSPLYQSLNSTMLELNNTLHNLESITRTLSDKPNALVFPEAVQKDPLPKARRQ